MSGCVVARRNLLSVAPHQTGVVAAGGQAMDGRTWAPSVAALASKTAAARLAKVRRFLASRRMVVYIIHIMRQINGPSGYIELA